MRVNDRGAAGVIDVPGLAGHQFDGGGPFFLGFVGEHDPADDVANGIDARHVGLEIFVDGDEAFFVDGDAELVEAELIRDGPAADADENLIDFFHAGVGSFAGFPTDFDFAVLDLRGFGDGFEAEFDALLFEQALQAKCHLIVAGREDALEEFEDEDFGAQAVPDGAHLHADVSAADDDHLFGDLGEGERFGAGENIFAVEFHARDFDRALPVAMRMRLAL